MIRVINDGFLLADCESAAFVAPFRFIPLVIYAHLTKKVVRAHLVHPLRVFDRHIGHARLFIHKQGYGFFYRPIILAQPQIFE